MASYSEPIEFQRAIADTSTRRRHLLLGNGFSIAAHRQFNYGSLYEVAVRRDDAIADLFAELGTENFEVALLAAREPEDAARIRSALYDAVVSVHPRHGELGAAARNICAEFLADFTGIARDPLRGKIFTTNYDLMLYWVIVAHSASLKCRDGFDADYVWKPGRDPKTFVYFLHGALHIHQRPMGVAGKVLQIEKLRSSTKASLLIQVRKHLDQGEFPLLISEAEPTHKNALIRRNPYLRAAQRAFQSACNDDENALFVIGHGLGEMDLHITDAIPNGRVKSVFVSTYSPADRDRAAYVAAQWAQTRATNGGPPIAVRTFDVGECPIWASAAVR